ncbi:Uncharacterised protein [uncultured archaeon]|nr:Uncharacterised protein [uncultured archaeon]
MSLNVSRPHRHRNVAHLIHKLIALLNPMLLLTPHQLAAKSNNIRHTKPIPTPRIINHIHTLSIKTSHRPHKNIRITTMTDKRASGRTEHNVRKPALHGLTNISRRQKRAIRRPAQ